MNHETDIRPDAVRFTVVIPARLASTRLPDKVLLDIAGKPMIRHVCERACESGAERVIVAVDDARVGEAAAGAKSNEVEVEVCHTSDRPRSGTERIAEVVERLDLAPDTILVNVQADEPLLPPVLIRQPAANLAARPDAAMATLSERIESVEQVFDPNAVKVVCDRDGYALYFSRAPIPWLRDSFPERDGWRPGRHFRHIGIYAYRAGYVHEWPARPAAMPETAESLEQLRALSRGDRIHVEEALALPGPGVDTEDDLRAVRALADANT